MWLKPSSVDASSSSLPTSSSVSTTSSPLWRDASARAAAASPWRAFTLAQKLATSSSASTAGPALTGGEQCGRSGPPYPAAHVLTLTQNHIAHSSRSHSRRRIGAALSSVAHADASAIHGGLPLPREALRHSHQVSSSNTPTPLVHCQFAIAL
uniref:Uncharacterized protein n=1 Tax=Oryza rufipogon TaxID=4529 RepID=A0A0E0PBG3_ORYRU